MTTMLRWLGTALISFGVLFGCKTTYNTPEEAESEVRKITFGSGGGFTGAVTTYILLENGQMFRKGDQDTSFTNHHSLSKKEAKQLFTELEEKQLSQYVINQPENMYHFLRWQDESGEHNCVWGDYQGKINPAIVSYYKKLMGMTFPTE